MPAVKGGAVESLVENLVKENEKYNRLELTVIGIFDEKALQRSRDYPATRFIFFQPGKWIERLDYGIYFIADKLLKKGGSASYRHIFRRFYMLRQTAQILAREDFDKVVLENSATLFRALKKKHNDVKYQGNYYFHIHNVVSGSYGCKRIIEGCKTLAVSQYINRTLPEFMQSIPEQNRRVVHNGIDISQFQINLSREEKNKLRERFRLRVTDFVVLFTGRLTQEKGIKELILSFQKLRMPNLKLLIVGARFFSSDIRSSFEEEIHVLADQLKDRIVFTGYVPYNMMPQIYAIADIAVLPSLWEEPAGLTIMEAVASGIPLITTNAGGIPEYIASDCAMILQRNKNIVNSIAKAIQDLVVHPEDRDRMSRASRQWASRMNLDVYYDKFISKISN